MCKCADGKVRAVPAEVRADRCKRFDARRNCTTCGHGCSQDDKSNRPLNEACPKWELKVLSTWGGSRRWPKKANPEPLPEDKPENKETHQ